MISCADTLTGTPCSESCIMRPDPTSLTAKASKQYLRMLNHCNHRNALGMSLRCTKNPAYVMINRLNNAERRMAIPPFLKRHASKKIKECHSGGIEYQDEQEFEEICRIRRQPSHPVDYCGYHDRRNDPEWNYIEEETSEEPGGWAVI